MKKTTDIKPKKRKIVLESLALKFKSKRSCKIEIKKPTK